MYMCVYIHRFTYIRMYVYIYVYLLLLCTNDKCVPCAMHVCRFELRDRGMHVALKVHL